MSAMKAYIQVHKNTKGQVKTITFKKVLEVFKECLTADTNCEIVLTTHGYTIMQWDENSKSWYGAEHCEAPEDLQEELLSSQRMNEMEKITKKARIDR